jgi:hypothetical protein
MKNVPATKQSEPPKVPTTKHQNTKHPKPQKKARNTLCFKTSQVINFPSYLTEWISNKMLWIMGPHLSVIVMQYKDVIFKVFLFLLCKI